MASVRRIVNWIKKEMPDKATSCIDIGCGNGVLLLNLVSDCVLL